MHVSNVHQCTLTIHLAGFSHIGFLTDDVDAAVKRLKDGGFTVEVDSEGRTIAHDYDNYFVELIKRS